MAKVFPLMILGQSIILAGPDRLPLRCSAHRRRFWRLLSAPSAWRDSARTHSFRGRQAYRATAGPQQVTHRCDAPAAGYRR